jgi:alpha-L-fucosidase
MLILFLVAGVSKGGNLRMNVGRTGRGELDGRAQNALRAYADWMKWHARSIYGCTQSEFTAPTDVRYTQNGKRLYVHVFAWPYKELHLPGLVGKVEYAQLLNDASEIRFKESGQSFVNAALEAATPDDSVTLQLPVLQPVDTVPVIEIFLK